MTNKQTDEEQLLGKGGQPWATSTMQGPVVVWTSTSERLLYVQLPSSDQPRKFDAIAIDPIVVSKRSGDDPVFVFWETKTRGHNSIQALSFNVKAESVVPSKE